VKRWNVILATAVIFGTGVVAGTFLSRNLAAPTPDLIHRPGDRPHSGSSQRPDRKHRTEFIMRVQEELDLTPEQRTNIEQIVRESQERTRALWEEFSPKLRAEYKSAQQEIRKVLTEEQRAKFEELMKQHRPPKPEGSRPHPHPPGAPAEPPPA